MKYGYNNLTLVHSAMALVDVLDDPNERNEAAKLFAAAGMSVMTDMDGDAHVYIDVRERGYMAGVAATMGVRIYTDSDVVNSAEFSDGAVAALNAVYSYAALIAFIKLVASGDIVEAKRLRNDVGHLRPSLFVLMNNILKEFGEE